mgnify:CR=1 FL=1
MRMNNNISMNVNYDEILKKAHEVRTEKAAAEPFVLPPSGCNDNSSRIYSGDRNPPQSLIEQITYNDKVTFSTPLNSKDHKTYYYINNVDYPLIQIFNMKHLTSEEVMTTTLSEGRSSGRIINVDTTNPTDMHKLIKRKWKCKELYVYPDGTVFGGKFCAPVRCLSFLTNNNNNNNEDNDDDGDDNDVVLPE